MPTTGLNLDNWKSKSFEVFIPAIALHKSQDGNARGTIIGGIITLDYAPVGDGQVTDLSQEGYPTEKNSIGYAARIKYDNHVYYCCLNEISMTFMDGF